MYGQRYLEWKEEQRAIEQRYEVKVLKFFEKDLMEFRESVHSIFKQCGEEAPQTPRFQVVFSQLNDRLHTAEALLLAGWCNALSAARWSPVK